MKVATRLREPLLLWDQPETTGQARDLPALLPIALGSAAFNTEDPATISNGLQHMPIGINTGRRGNVPPGWRLLVTQAKALQRSKRLRVPAANVDLPNINEAILNLADQFLGRRETFRNQGRIRKASRHRRGKLSNQVIHIPSNISQQGAVPGDMDDRLDIPSTGAAGRTPFAVT